jgi:hypothetical protein
MTWIQTYTGVAWDLGSPRAEDVRAEDIAHSLAHQCRFTGHADVHYSVAEHSVRAYRLVRDVLPHGKRVPLAALLHDASEAYLGDLSSPLKALMPDAVRKWWRSVVLAHDEAIAEWAGLPSPSVFHMGHVKRADLIMLAWEARDLMGPRPRPWIDMPEPPAGTLEPWTADDAKREFLDTLAGLM